MRSRKRHLRSLQGKRGEKIVAILPAKSEKKIKENKAAMSLVFIGSDMTKEVFERFKAIKRDCGSVYSYMSVKSFSCHADAVKKADFLILVVDAGELSCDFDLLKEILKEKVEIAFVIGKFCNTEIEKKVMTNMRCIHIEKAAFLEKRLAVIVNQLAYAFRKKNLFSIDYADVCTMMKYQHNFVWFGKSYGSKKADYLAKQIMDSEWFKKMMTAKAVNIIAIVNGDYSLGDIEKAMEPITNMKRDNGLCLSLNYEEEPFDEMEMLVLGSW